VFELLSLPGVSEDAISVGTLFSLASEVSAKLFGHVLWENVHRVDRRVTEVKHTQILFLFGSSINLYSMTRLLLPLMARRIVFFCVGCCRVALTSVTLFGSGSSIGSGTKCTVHEGTLFILPWSAGLCIIPRINGVGSVLHDCNSGHGSLMQVDLGEQNVFKTVKALFSVLLLSLVIGQALDMILPFPKSVAKSTTQLKIHSRQL
jgi:hypothetical protein